MDFAELKKKDATSLQKLLNEQRNLLRELRFKTASKQLKNIREVRVVRKTIAHILTVLSGQVADKK